ncbi:MAG: hypothetical protein KBD47_01440 [Candidatus Pacebacteria bacterium]|nr:hypothetical protein [Candidatus Paceibacterota bacterium]
MKKKNNTAKTIVALSAGAVAIAASSYYFFGPAGKVHQKKALGWMIKMKGEIIEKIQDGGEITEKAYHAIVDSVLASYVASGKVATPELQAFAKTIKGHWKSILKSLPKKKIAKK